MDILWVWSAVGCVRQWAVGSGQSARGSGPPLRAGRHGFSSKLRTTDTNPGVGFYSEGQNGCELRDHLVRASIRGLVIAGPKQCR